jgi:hypothetical protein
MKRRLSIALGGNPGEKDWTRFVDGIVRDHNSRKIPGTSVARNSVNKGNYVRVLGQIYGASRPAALIGVAGGSNVSPATGRKIWNFRIGDEVLLQLKADYSAPGTAKGVFSKPSVRGTYGKKVYAVAGRSWKTSSDFYIVPVYSLSGLRGLFYESELLRFRGKSNAHTPDEGDYRGGAV